MATECATLTVAAASVAGAQPGARLCMAMQLNGLGIAFELQTLFTGSAGVHEEVKLDLAGYFALTTKAEWISETLGADTCFGGGASGHVVFGGRIEVGVCGDLGSVETVYAVAGVGVGAGGGIFATVTASNTQLPRCEGQCSPPSNVKKPKKPGPSASPVIRPSMPSCRCSATSMATSTARWHSAATRGSRLRRGGRRAGEGPSRETPTTVEG